LLALLQQVKSSDNVSSQVSVIPSNMTTQTDNNFISSFSSWIIDSGVTDHICLSLTYFTSYHQINPISVKLPNEIKSLPIILEVFFSIKIMS